MTHQINALSEIVKRLKKGGKVLISSHVNPDGDSVGSQLAMYDLVHRLGCDPMIIVQDQPSARYNYLAKCELTNIYNCKVNYPEFDLAILLDVPDPSRVGDVQALLADIPEIIYIDHHPPDHGNTGTINLIDESVAAVGMLVYDLFREAGLTLSKDNAEEIYTAILTDTGRFRFSSTTSEVLRVCADLLEAGASPKKINDALYSNFSEDQLRLRGELTATMELFHDGQTCFLIYNQPLFKKYPQAVSETEGLVEYSLYTTGVQVGALLRELKTDRTKVSLRSHDTFDVAELAKSYGGGGHRNAAGCWVDKPLQEAKVELLEKIGSGLQL